MSIVEFDGATLRVGGRAVLSNVSFKIEAGEFIAVLGPNGAGKTTLMRAILGLLLPSAGTITVLGSTPRRGNQAIGYLPQLHTNFADVRIQGRGFIAASLYGERWGLPLSRAREYLMVDEALGLVGARDLGFRPLGDMSGGERQRLLLAQALVGKPELLLLDEPLLSLDPRRQEMAIEVVRTMCRERKITVLFSAHELNQLLGAVDRVLYLGNGQAVLGSVDEVVNAPVLSRLYGTEIHVVRADGHIFVMSRGLDVERSDHLHDHHDPAHEHGKSSRH